MSPTTTRDRYDLGMAQRLATRAEIVGEAGTPGGVAPDFNGVTDDQLAVWTIIAAHNVEPNRWRNLASEGHALLTAHYLATAPGLGLSDGGLDEGEAMGPLSAEADGPASRSFGQFSGESLAAEDALLATTPYGRAFLQLRRVVRGFGTVSVANGCNTVRW